MTVYGRQVWNMKIKKLSWKQFQNQTKINRKSRKRSTNHGTEQGTQYQGKQLNNISRFLVERKEEKITARIKGCLISAQRVANTLGTDNRWKDEIERSAGK